MCSHLLLILSASDTLSHNSNLKGAVSDSCKLFGHNE